MTSIVVGTAGHIDHGKSALVQALTGTDPDRLKEEQARGITIDLGFAHQAIAGITFSFVDVPGHERFVKNMLAGVGGIDLVVLVVAADESVMPQTREHFDICRLLHVPAGLIALTKSDLADPETLDLARLEIRELVAGSFLEGAPIVPVSARTGEGLDAFRTALVDVSRQARGRRVDGVTRLPIDRVFSMKGFGTVVTGTLVSGRIAVDDELILAPAAGERRVKVRGVQVHGVRQNVAVAGQRAAVNLGGVEVEDVARGQHLVAPDAFEETRIADALVEILPTARPLKHGARVRFHQGTAEVLGRVALVGPLDPTGGIPAAQPGTRRFVRLRLETPVIVARGDRYIVRAYSPPVTIAGGLILDPRPPRTAIRSDAALARCSALAFDPDADDRTAVDMRVAATLVEEGGVGGLSRRALVTRVGIDPRDVAARVAALVSSRRAVAAGDVVVATAVFQRLQQAVVASLTAHHRMQPLSGGVPREELREQLFGRGDAAVFERALADLVAAGTIVARERVALAAHRVELSPEEERARGALARAYLDGGLTPPDASLMAAELGVAAPVADRMLKLLQRQKVLVRLGVLLFHDEALTKLKAEVATLKASAGAAARLDVATFKGRFGVSRKFAIPLLEYLDRERITRRVGDVRLVL
jgi:selenocysteine-specific elongation factor